MHKRTLVAGGVLALLFAFGVGLYTGVSSLATHAQVTSIVGADPSKTVEMQQFWDAWRILESRFVQTHSTSSLPSEEERVWGAIAGLAESYGDPYTVFLPPQEAQAFNESVNGSFSGVGMELGLKDGDITVVAPLKDSPAERAGIKSGDKVLSADGKSLQGATVETAVKLIRGEKGTTVVLTLMRAGASEPFEVSIVRDTINIPILKTRLEGGVYIIELYSFSATSPELFRQALRDFFLSGSTKLVLDLRGNPGGYLEAAVEMASYFLPVGQVVVTEDSAGHGTDNAHRSLGYNVFAGKKLSMAILVDQGSASASEILAGALSQHGVAKLIGTRTFGKGSVQQLVQLGGGAELKVTVARWLTPGGTSISDGGLTPDIEVDRTAEDRTAGKDPQMDAAEAWLAIQ